MISEAGLRSLADSLKSDSGENPEYDRALRELVAYSVGKGEEELLKYDEEQALKK